VPEFEKDGAGNLALVSALAIYEVLRTFEKSEEQDQSRETAETVKRIEISLQTKR
jgi:hypothetical protein